MDDYTALKKLKEYYLGDDWYINDEPIRNFQANEIAVREIVYRYPKDRFYKILSLNIIILIINLAMLCNNLKF